MTYEDDEDDDDLEACRILKCVREPVALSWGQDVCICSGLESCLCRGTQLPLEMATSDGRDVGVGMALSFR